MNSPHPAPTPQFAQTSPARPAVYARRFAFLIAASFLLMLFVSTALIPNQRARAAAQQTAHVIVQFDDAARNVHSLTFTDPISGLRALQLAGFDIVTTTSSFGVAVCSIEGVGCPATDCFCNATKYWGYSSWDGSTWQPYAVGAGASVISRTGALEGWRWGEYGDAQVPAGVTMAAADALQWLSSRQVITSGGYGGASGVVETMLAIGANGLDADAWRRSPQSPSLEGAVLADAAHYSRGGPAAVGKLNAALAAADACVPQGVVAPSVYYSATLGAYSPNAADNAWAILGTLARNEVVPASAVANLKSLAQANGGWEWGAGWGVDTNATALAVQALNAAGETPSSVVITHALAYLKSTQNTDGGFPYARSAPGDPVAPSDSNSTAYVVQAIVAAGQDPADTVWQKSGSSPLDFLLARQLPDGSLEWQAGKGPNLLAVQQAIPALLGQVHPASVRSPQSCPTMYLPGVFGVQ